ncbi:TPA: HP1 family phage holin [Citrobacter freundii]|uniref:HP1 family phage holin n=1 Tax=Citrobacter TaxID=544 RepID=UPI000657FF07|nr:MULTISPECIES: HP1 family phage holin [Citrobacter]KLV46073.1 hypothetical protein SK31_01838 [Citrobacter sp. MGH99]MDE8798525.1 HP1 family phage holin [Citrobacter freundii]MDE8803623.1 HP1 family phage holin [Citrobacter freundii]DAO21206.1 MAG TPA: holin [Caudoviricetes sp.]
MDKVTSFIAYWLSIMLAALGGMTLQEFATWFGVFGVAVTAFVNWYYRRKTFLLLRDNGLRPEVGREISR